MRLLSEKSETFETQKSMGLEILSAHEKVEKKYKEYEIALKGWIEWEDEFRNKVLFLEEHLQTGNVIKKIQKQLLEAIGDG